MQDAPQSAYGLIFDFIHRAKQASAAVAEQSGLSLIQMHTLALPMDGGLPMVQLSSYLACDASYVTGIIDRLEDMGLVERHENVHDRRVKMVSLTAKGRAVKKSLQARMEAKVSEVMGNLSAAEQQEFYRLLAKTTAGTAAESAAHSARS